ncbi:hypothetical protein NC653_025104 [Populus alba x Populus x berolinensis]|uniref:Uncharacterized protein n=1 Tax=Populus alba x Populus x berolinensis TaxID=444605 RepID=A0AAD6Q8N4_9ROSI|nr:hypothetical protein NC653_025104 [Populus alba x Populus x berolinensis]
MEVVYPFLQIGDFSILVRYGFSVPKALFFNFLSALVALAGTALVSTVFVVSGFALGTRSRTVIFDRGQVPGFTAGGFVYIAAAGVLVEMNNSKSTLRTSAVHITSLVLGMTVAPWWTFFHLSLQSFQELSKRNVNGVKNLFKIKFLVFLDCFDGLMLKIIF